MAKIEQKKAYVNIGIVPIRQGNGKIERVQKYLVMPERFARYMKLVYSTTPPAPSKVTIKKGKLAGRIIEVEFQSTISGIKYELGYYNGIATSLADSKRGVKIKWIPIHIPRGLTTREFLKVITAKIVRKPQFIKMPSGKSTRLTDA